MNRLTKAFSKAVAVGLIALLTFSSTAYAAQTVTYFHNDLLGSPVAATNQNGDVIWRENYQAFGEKVKSDDTAKGNSIGYTGHVNDATTGLTYMQARYYDPILGRFYANDPVGFQENNPTMFNRYAYANNNPYVYVDPDGREIVATSIVNNRGAINKRQTNISFTAVLVDNSGLKLSSQQMSEIGSKIKSQIESSFSGHSGYHSWSTTVSIETLDTASNLDNLHFIIIEPKSFFEGSKMGSAVLGGKEMHLNIFGVFTDRILKRTSAHEFGHLAKLDHDEKGRESLMWQSKVYSGLEIHEYRIEQIVEEF